MIIDLVLKGKQVIVFGAGREASRKVDGLLTQDCRIIVIAENIHENIRHFAKLGKLDLEKCRIPNGDYLEKWEDPFLVIAGTDDRNLNRKIVDAARRRRCYAYALDDPEYSDFSHPAVINFADTLQVALSTGGRSPLMARRLKERLEPVLKQSITAVDILLIRLQEKLRLVVKSRLSNPDERKSFLTKIANDPKILHNLTAKNINEAEQQALELLDGFKNPL